jgi:flagellar protein FliL
MAKVAKEEAPPEGPKPSAGKKKLLIIIVVVVVLAVAGVGAFFALKGGKGAQEGGEGGEAVEGGEGEEGAGGEEAGPAAPAVLPLETFIVNLQVKGSFLKTTVQLEFAEPELPKTIENEVPKIRDTVIRILSSKSSSEILTAEGKERLRDELRDAVNQTLGAEDVSKVYFTEFIIQ